MSAAVLRVAGARHRYGVRVAVDNVSFEVGAGRFTLLLGLNGAGKSTLFSSICGLLAPEAGSFEIAGADMARDPQAAHAALGIVFQARTLDLDLSVMQNLTYAAALHGVDRRQGRARAEKLLERIELADCADRKIRALSGGQARRVEIARALIHQPVLLLLDEPTVGLDVKARAGIVRLVRELTAERGVGVLWATHLLDEARDSDDAVFLHKGQLVEQGVIAEVIARLGAPDLRGAFAKLAGLSEEAA